MKPEAQRIAIAEACGWKKQREIVPGEWVWHNPDGRLRGQICIPNYPNDLNAMHEAENTAVENYTIRPWKYADVLMQVLYAADHDYYCNAAQYAICHSTAPQRAEAFLRTIESGPNENTPPRPPHLDRVTGGV